MEGLQSHKSYGKILRLGQINASVQKGWLITERCIVMR